MTTDSTAHHAAHGAPEQHAGGPGHEPLGEQGHPAHHQDGHGGHDDSPEAIRKEIRRYLLVFGALAVLTIITVAISQLHLPTKEAIVLALIVATIKGSLVAAFFMHLISERKLVFAILVMTVFFFAMMIWVPGFQRRNAHKAWPGYELNTTTPAPAAPAGHDAPAH